MDFDLFFGKNVIVVILEKDATLMTLPTPSLGSPFLNLSSVV